MTDDEPDLPDGWEQVERDVGRRCGPKEDHREYEAAWKSEDHKVVIEASCSQDDTTPRYPVVADQWITHDGIGTDIQIAAEFTGTFREAEDRAVELMEEINDGQHLHHVLGMQEWRENYQFYCISNNEIPGDLTADDLIDDLEDEEFDGEDVERMEEEADVTVEVSIFPRHQQQITHIND